MEVDQPMIEGAEEQKILEMDLLQDPNIILAAKTLKRMEESTFKCNICLDRLINPVRLPCGHIFCKFCIETNIRTVTKQNYLESCVKNTSSCPMCGVGPVTKRSLTPDKELSELSDLFQGLLEDLENAGRISKFL